jgi:prevent-host-death family protein
MTQVNIHEAKTHLSRLLLRVAAGEEIVISRAGRPVARLVPFEQGAGARVPGRDRGTFHVPPELDEPLPEDIQAGFES